MTVGPGGRTSSATPWWRKSPFHLALALMLGIALGAGAVSAMNGSSETETLTPPLAASQAPEAAEPTEEPEDSSEYRALEVRFQNILEERDEALRQARVTRAAIGKREAAVERAETAVARREQAAGQGERTIARTTVPGEGVYEVGVDMSAGTYRSAGRADCYYALLGSSDTGNIISNNITSGQTAVTVVAGQWFQTQSCAAWVPQ